MQKSCCTTYVCQTNIISMLLYFFYLFVFKILILDNVDIVVQAGNDRWSGKSGCHHIFPYFPVFGCREEIKGEATPRLPAALVPGNGE